MAIGFAFGGTIAVLLALVAGLSRLGENGIDPLLQIVRMLPLFGLIPVFIVWFGIGELPKIILIALGAAIPLYLNTFAGIRSVDAKLAEVGQVLRLRRRTTVLTMRPFQVSDEPGREEWRRLLLSVERQLVLAGRYPGMLADDLADYLFARSTGHFASLMALVSRGCLRAIRTGAERLDADLMDQVNNDAAAEADRRELAAAIEAGLLTARPASRARTVTDR
jgi:hypothetical protein